mmetsp:Transcript_138032/g.240038  ORF Transcript_138032/g.240038 Transcript_138032/m.240038 type:complete len:768 (+) Transcript_138032:66-2369(+)
MAMIKVTLVLLLVGANANANAGQSREASLEEEWSKELQDPETKVVTYKSPIKRVVNLLGKMKAELESEAGKESSMYDEMVCWCETTDKEKTAAIAEAESKASSLQAELEEGNAKKGRLSAEIGALKTQIAADTEALKTAVAIREKALAEFTDEEKEAMQLITNLKNAIAVLSKHHSLLQLDSPIFASVRAVLRDVSMKYDFMTSGSPGFFRRAPRHQAASLLSVDGARQMGKALESVIDLHGGEDVLPVDLAQHLLAESATDGTGKKGSAAFMQNKAPYSSSGSYNARSSTIFGILDQMKDEFEANLSDAQKAELQARKDFAALKSSKEAQIAAGKEKLDSLETESADTGKAISDAQEDYELTNEQRSKDVEYLQNVRVQCQKIDIEWEARSKTRAEELKAVTEAMAILTEDDAAEHLRKTVTFLQVGAISESESKVRRSRAVEILRSAARSPSFDADDLLMEWHGRNSAPSLSGARSKLATLAVSVQLDSFTKVKEMMDKMVADLKAEQADEVQFKAKCGEDMNSNEKETFDKKEQKSDLEAKIDTLDKSISTLKDEIAAANKDIKYNEDEIAKASETREKETAEFKIVIADQRATQDILAKAIKRLEAFYGEKPSFLQGAAHVSQTPPVKFDAYATNAGSSTVLGLLAQIVEDSKKLEADATTAETTSQADYEAFVATSQDSIASLQKMVTEKTMSVSQAGVDRSQADSDLASTNDELATLSEVLADLHGQCDFVLKNFEIRQKARGEEIAAILSAKAILSGATA